MATPKVTLPARRHQYHGPRPEKGCMWCGSSKKRRPGPSVRCLRCLGRENARREKKLAKGICGTCSKPAAPGRKRCEVCLARGRDYENAKNRRLKEQTIARYGGKCMCPGGCDVKDMEFLCIDHINGGGNKHRKELGGNRLKATSKEYRSRGGVNFYKWLERTGFPEGYRVLCYNCNCARGFSGYCPHERRADTAKLDTRADQHPDS
jgi:hypothetical protein